MIKNIEGKRFGILTAITPLNSRTKNKCVDWACRCDCGKQIIIPSYKLLRDRAQSCGCLQDEAKKSLSRIHAETLELAFKGLPIAEIATLRHRSIHTIKRTLTILRERTETRNTQELLYEALSRGWLTPPQRYVD